MNRGVSVLASSIRAILIAVATFSCHEWDSIFGQPDDARQELEEARNLISSPMMRMQMAEGYAVIREQAWAEKILNQLRVENWNRGDRYSATNSFVNGMQAYQRRDFQSAASQFKTALSHYSDSKVAYFHALASIKSGDLDSAISSLKSISDDRVAVLEDSVASLIPLSEFMLANCYRDHGNKREVQRHLDYAQRMWAAADIEAKKKMNRLLARHSVIRSYKNP